jgi:hypothetical protein
MHNPSIKVTHTNLTIVEEITLEKERHGCCATYMSTSFFLCNELFSFVSKTNKDKCYSPNKMHALIAEELYLTNGI